MDDIVIDLISSSPPVVVIAITIIITSVFLIYLRRYTRRGWTRPVKPSKSNQAYSFAKEGPVDALGQSLGKRSFQINAKDEWGQTELSIAAEHGDCHRHALDAM